MDHDLHAVAVALTGLIQAFEAHADANPQLGDSLRGYAAEIRDHRDSVLRRLGITPGTPLDDHGGASEWAAAIGTLRWGNHAWPDQPTRGKWLSVEQANEAP
ncbi:hypothetical protein BJF79_13750 [Actinomadura sp. CNU-125]|nr:hypothetical protein BJF79_13750 [Actinomadura sp. CNU-125]